MMSSENLRRVVSEGIAGVNERSRKTGVNEKGWKALRFRGIAGGN